jgi:hypothetical protein
MTHQVVVVLSFFLGVGINSRGKNTSRRRNAWPDSQTEQYLQPDAHLQNEERIATIPLPAVSAFVSAKWAFPSAVRIPETSLSSLQRHSPTARIRLAPRHKSK